MEKPTSLSAHRAQKIFRAWPILLVFFLALLTRLYWIHEKEYMYIDDPTSVSLAYNLPGWGKKTFEAGHILTGKELRQQCYIDDRGGLEGLWDDLAALHHDNRDGSHASLYYMALRCALTGVDTPSTDMLIRRSCGLNLVFFGLSFLSMTLLLHMLFPGKTMLTTFCLLLAYMNPVSVSNVLQAREYLMAEWLFVLWAYWCLRAAARIHNQQTLWAPGTFTGGLAISAALLSCGYFNALFFGLSLLCLAVYSCRQHAYKDLGFYPVLGIVSLLLCVLLYEGFFNFLHDARATEVADKMQGGDWLSNLRLTVIGLGYITALRTVYQPFRSTVFSGCGLLSRVGLAARPQSSGRHIRSGVYRLCMVRTPHGIRESHLGQRMAFTRETNLALRSRPRGKEHPSPFNPLYR